MSQETDYCYVYTFESSLDGKVFYVGAGSGTRILSHFSDARGKKEKVSRAASRMRLILQQGGQIIVRKPYEHLSCIEANRLEKQLIEQYGYGQLVNHPWSKHPRLVLAARNQDEAIIVSNEFLQVSLNCPKMPLKCLTIILIYGIIYIDQEKGMFPNSVQMQGDLRER